MKRLTNILSYLWLLLLLPVVACSDFEEIVINMQGEEEVELTIKTNIPSLGGSTRTAPTENITQITALAFAKDDDDYKLIKVAIEDVTTSPSANPSTSGKYTVKVPVRTRRIHFIAKNADVFDTFSTETDYGKGEDELLKDLTTTELHYWGKLDFNDATALKAGGDVTLIRNMAKLVLDTDSNDDYIAGLLNYNVKGTIVPYKDGVLGYQTATNHDLPSDFEIASDETERTDKGKVHYMFEEFNDISSETTGLVYVICNIDDKFYKIAFKSGDSYYYIIRNQLYTIKIAGTLDTKLGKDSYTDAVQNGSPINDTTKEQVHIEFEPDGETTFAITDNEVSMYLGETGKVKVVIPEGITELQIGYSAEYFDEGGLTANVIDGDVIAATSTETKDNIYIKTYNVTDIREFELSIDLKESVTEAIDGLEIQFIGSGELKQSNDKLIVDVLKRDDLTVTPTTVQLKKSAGSEFTVSVTMPSFDNFTGNFELQVTDVNDKFTISPEPQEGKYTVEEGSTTTFTFTFEADGNVGDVYTINFDAISQFHHLTGTTTVTLIDDAVPDQDVYEIWVGDGSAWTGTTNSVEFFGYKTTADSNGFDKNTTPPTGFRTTFYDALTVNGTTYSADNHKQQAMLMGSDDSFTFTIPEGSNRWLTLLVANDGDDSDTPSIQLSNGSSWITAGDTEDLTNGTYNFAAEGEITTAGRLIRYELPAGTYTLKGSDAEYLLYYMRVSTERPTMTDVAQPLLTDYNLSWSGGNYDDINGKGYLKISDGKHIVDEDNLTHTVSLKADNSLEKSLNLSNYTLFTTFDLYITQPTYTFVEPNDDNNNNGSITIGNDNLDEYKKIVPSSELLLENNGGDYVLSGKIIEPAYKYSAFYDVLQLNQVKYEVKNPIVPALYNSMDGDKLTPVENWTTMDDAWAIGFFMPSPMPIEYATPSDRPAIAISIPDWTKSDSGTSSGLGVVVDSENKIYTLTTQDNSVHPRPGWTYKIQWADRASSTISPEIVDKSSDVYFTYMGNIAKKVDVAVPEIEETSLNITLDFYTENGVDFNNLTFGETKFYLKATIPSGIPAGKQILLNLATSEGRGGINEWQSWNQDASKGISYHFNEKEVVDGLTITTAANQTEYLMCWQYVRSDESNTNDVSITYTVSSDKHTLTGKETATITIKGNSQAVDNPLDLNLDFYALDTNGQEVDNGVNGSYTDLLLGTSRFVLEVTIDGPDAQAYNGQTVYLAGNFETVAAGAAENGWAIHWGYSRTDGAISYYGNNNNGSGLQFQIDGSTSYKIEWVFKTGGNYNGGEIGFDYKISAHTDTPTTYNLTGDTQATIAFTNEAQILVATNGSEASNSINLSLEYGDNSVEEFTVDVPVPTNVSGINIAASDFAVSIGKVAADGEQYPGAAVTVNGNYTFTDSDKSTAPRFKFKLNGTPANNQSVITFTDVNGVASPATVTVNWTQRDTETNQTTIWSGAMDLQWTQNYLEATNNQLAAGTQVTLNFTTTGGQIKLHDSNGTSISGDNGFAVANGATQYSFTLQNVVNGLKINGNNVRMTSIVVSTATASTENVVIDCDFNNDTNGFTLQGQGSLSSNGALVLNNTEDRTNAWDAQAMYATDKIVYGATYTLTFKAKIDEGTIGGLVVAIQSGGGSYTYYYVGKNINDIFNNVQKDDQGWAEIVFDNNINITNSDTQDNPTHFMFNFGDLVGTIYIDDLKLVKND